MASFVLLTASVMACVPLCTAERMHSMNFKDIVHEEGHCRSDLVHALSQPYYFLFPCGLAVSTTQHV
jgi:hypothetical protein